MSACSNVETDAPMFFNRERNNSIKTWCYYMMLLTVRSVQKNNINLLGIKKYMKTLRGHGEQILSFAINLFGLLSSASLLSILLPGQVFGVVLCVGVSILIILARHTLKIYVCWIINVMVVKISTMFSSIFKTKDSANGSNDTTYPNPSLRVDLN